MDNILRDLSPARLALAVEENLSAWIPIFGLTGASRINDPPGVRRSISPITMPMFNSIMDANLEPKSVYDLIRYIKNDAEMRKVPLMWWVGPSTRPVDLGEQLVKFGFSLEEDSPGMAVELAKLNNNLLNPGRMSIHEVRGDASLREWCLTTAEGFQVPATTVEYLVKSWFHLLRIVDPRIIQIFLVRLDDKAVATSMLVMAGGVAGIYSVSTIPEARRKGIGAQVTLYPLLKARKLGYKAGILAASEMGVGVYRSLGFEEYCRIKTYVYYPTSMDRQSSDVSK